MDIYEARRQVVERLIETRYGGSQAKFAVDADLSPSYVTRMLKTDGDGRKRIGDDMAIRLEGTTALALAPGSLLSPTLYAHSELGRYDAEPAGRPRTVRPTRVVGAAKLGDNGYYEETGHDAGWVDSYSADPAVYALRVVGDSMHPAIRHGSFVVVDPNGACVPGEYVAIALVDGRKMVKELVFDRATEVVVESVNGGQRLTLQRTEIVTMHPVAAVVLASKWRPERSS